MKIGDKRLFVVETTDRVIHVLTSDAANIRPGITLKFGEAIKCIYPVHNVIALA